MSITNQIIEALEEINEPTIFEKFREILKDKKKLKRNDWLNLRKLMKTDYIYEVLKLDLTPRETKILGCCIVSISLKSPGRVLEAILEKDDENTPSLLNSLLHKKKKFDVQPVQPYLIKMCQGPIRLIHLHLLQTVYKNYPSLIEENVLNFCRSNPHEICQEIYKSKDQKI